MAMGSEDAYEYQKSGRYFAQSPDGLEAMAADELASLGASDAKPAYRGVYFGADRETLYRVNYTARLVTRVLAPLLTFDCHSAKYLYKVALDIDWSDFLRVDETFAVFANVANSAIRHSQYAALRVKDAVADQFRERMDRRPDVDPTEPDVWINLFIHNNRAVLSLDASGGSLHGRGYRLGSVEAPMQETVAAAVIALSGWDGERPLRDPMCGSGTLLGEALMRYCRVPAGYLRARRAPFGFERLPDFDRTAWDAVRSRADAAIRELPAGLITGSDADRSAVSVARENVAALPSGGRVRLETARFQDLAAIEGATIVCNPPYGLRLGDDAGAGALVKEFGDFLKKRCTGSTAYIYFGRRNLLKHIGLHPSAKWPLKSGGLDGRLARFELY